MLKTTAIVLFLLFVSSRPSFSQNTDPVSLDELRTQADEVLKMDNVTARRDIDVVFALVDRLLATNQQDMAESYITQGLRSFPWDLEHQMIYAEMLTKKGKEATAKEKAALVLKYAEKDDLISRARKLLGTAPLPDIPGITSLSGTNHCIVLIPFQGCDRWLILRIKDELCATLGVPVYVQKIDMNYPPVSRDRRQSIINRFKREVEKNLSDPHVSKSMKDLRLEKKDIQVEANVLKLMHHIARLNGRQGEETLETYLKDATGKDPQWNADQLLETLVNAVRPFRRQNIAYLGITPVDIYTADYNFLFGWAYNSGGIISYRRFSAVFNDETPSQDRLIKRTLMQCLSSLGFVHGIEKCSDPTCAKAYPNSLTEHDAKTGALCSECKNAFKKALGQDK